MIIRKFRFSKEINVEITIWMKVLRMKEKDLLKGKFDVSDWELKLVIL